MRCTDCHKECVCSGIYPLCPNAPLLSAFLSPLKRPKDCIQLLSTDGIFPEQLVLIVLPDKNALAPVSSPCGRRPTGVLRRATGWLVVCSCNRPRLFVWCCMRPRNMLTSSGAVPCLHTEGFPSPSLWAQACDGSACASNLAVTAQA